MRNVFSQRSVCCQGALIWNSHFNKFKFNLGYVTFKYNVKQCLLNS